MDFDMWLIIAVNPATSFAIWIYNLSRRLHLSGPSYEQVGCVLANSQLAKSNTCAGDVAARAVRVRTVIAPQDTDDKDIYTLQKLIQRKKGSVLFQSFSCSRVLGIQFTFIETRHSSNYVIY